jgi:hypothetical protein
LKIIARASIICLNFKSQNNLKKEFKYERENSFGKTIEVCLINSMLFGVYGRGRQSAAAADSDSKLLF